MHDYLIKRKFLTRGVASRSPDTVSYIDTDEMSRPSISERLQHPLPGTVMDSGYDISAIADIGNVNALALVDIAYQTLQPA